MGNLGIMGRTYAKVAPHHLSPPPHFLRRKKWGGGGESLANAECFAHRAIVLFHPLAGGGGIG